MAKRKIIIESHHAGSHYDTIDNALVRLGPQAEADYISLETSQDIRNFADAHKGDLTESERFSFDRTAGYYELLAGS